MPLSTSATRLGTLLLLCQAAGSQAGATPDPQDPAPCLAALGGVLVRPYFPAVHLRCRLEQGALVRSAQLDFDYDRWVPWSQQQALDYGDFQQAASTALFAHLDGQLQASGFVAEDLPPPADQAQPALQRGYHRKDSGTGSISATLRVDGQGGQLRIAHAAEALPDVAPGGLAPPHEFTAWVDPEALHSMLALPGGRIEKIAESSHGNRPMDLAALPAEHWNSPDLPVTSGQAVVALGPRVELRYAAPLADVVAQYRQALPRVGWTLGVPEGNSALLAHYRADGRQLRLVLTAYAEGGTRISAALHEPGYSDRFHLIAEAMHNGQRRHVFSPTLDAVGQAHPESMLQLRLAARLVLEDGDGQLVALLPARVEGSEGETPAAEAQATRAVQWALAALRDRGVPPERVRSYPGPVRTGPGRSGFVAGVAVGASFCWTEPAQTQDQSARCACGPSRHRPPYGSQPGACP